MAVKRDFDLLDDYLANRLGQEDKSAFEQRLKSDTELRNEYDLQQQFIEGIKKARVAELKSMMNNIPVPAAPSTVSAVAGKVAIWVVLIGMIGTGLYFYFDKGQTTTPVDQTSDKIIPGSEQEQQNKATTNVPGDTSEEAPVVSEEPASSEQKPGESPKAIKKQKSGADASAKEPAIDVFDPSAEAQDNTASDATNETAPRVSHDPSITVEIDSENKKYNFHYQFKDSQLILYGPFEKNLYEIMEFFNDKKRTMFLFYSDQYYLLKDDNSKLKPLTAIQDPALIKKLKEYRNN
jgi:hypothetical protein